MMDGVGAANAVAAVIDRKIAVILDFMAFNQIFKFWRKTTSYFGFEMLLSLFERFTLGVRQKNVAVMKYTTLQPAKMKNVCA